MEQVEVLLQQLMLAPQRQPLIRLRALQLTLRMDLHGRIMVIIAFCIFHQELRLQREFTDNLEVFTTNTQNKNGRSETSLVIQLE